MGFILQNNFTSANQMPIASIIFLKLVLYLFLTNILSGLFPDSIKNIFICLDSMEQNKVCSNFCLNCLLFILKIVVIKIFERKVSVPSMSKIVSHHKNIKKTFYLLMSVGDFKLHHKSE